MTQNGPRLVEIRRRNDDPGEAQIVKLLRHPLRTPDQPFPVSHGKWGSSFLVQTLPTYHRNFANSEGASQDEHIPSEKYDGMADLNPFKQGFVEPVESQ